MKLNKRDMLIYKRFLEQVECGFNDKVLDKYVPVLIKFINNNYTSDSSPVYDLEDFIEEGLVYINGRRNLEEEGRYNTGFYFMELKTIYQRFKKNGSKENENRLNTHIIDNKDFEEEILFYDFINSMELKENERSLIEALVRGIDANEFSEGMSFSRQYASQLKAAVLKKIKKSPLFSEYYGVEADKLFEYESFLKTFLNSSCRADLIESSRSLDRNINPRKTGPDYSDLLDMFTYLDLMTITPEIGKYKRLIKKDKEEIEKKLAKRSGK